MQLRSDAAERFFVELNPIGKRKYTCRRCYALLSSGDCMLGYRNTNRNQTRLIRNEAKIKPTEPCPKPLKIKSMTAELAYQVMFHARRVVTMTGRMPKDEPLEFFHVQVVDKTIAIDRDEADYISELIMRDAEKIEVKDSVLYNRLKHLAKRFRRFLNRGGFQKGHKFRNRRASQEK